jgi:diguanylate cyclase (GGDEF)-like protein
VTIRAPHKLPGTAYSDRRLRAAYRRELQNSVHGSALLVSAAMAAATGIDTLVVPGVSPAYPILTVPLVATSLAVAMLVRRRGRRYAVALGMLVGLMPLLAVATAVAFVPLSNSVTMGILSAIPLTFAIFVPLERRPHRVWLVLADVIFLGIVAAIQLSRMDIGQVAALIGAASAATALSLGANEIQVRRRHQMNDQLLAVRALYGRMKEHEQDLRRQDEFLFMQQETLVVQQAELLRLNEELESIARLDALTGLGNRLRLNEDLAALAARIERNGGAAGVLLMDLDRFKRLNDSAGHLAGDAALRGVAEAMRKTSRVGDGLYRYGGEEFLVLLHDCDRSGLYAAGERYIAAIESAGMPHPDNLPYGVVTASAGATELSLANCRDVDSALHDADEALYLAKSRGRNKLEIYGGLEHGRVVPMAQERAAS